jgi:hypothetical protein
MLMPEDKPVFSDLAMKVILIFALGSRRRHFADDVQRQLFSTRNDDCDDRQRLFLISAGIRCDAFGCSGCNGDLLR